MGFLRGKTWRVEAPLANPYIRCPCQCFSDGIRMEKGYKNIQKKTIQIGLQQKVGQEIVKKRAGRPQKIGVKKYQFTLPITLHNDLKSKQHKWA